MIYSSMPQGARLEEAKSVQRILTEIAPLGFIAGGYPRDILTGRLPRDIDFWLPLSAYPTQESRDLVTNQLYAALGQQGRNVREGRFGNAAHPGYLAADTPETAFHVYELFRSNGEYEPLNVIFRPEIDANERDHYWRAMFFISSYFDVNICRAFILDTGGGIIIDGDNFFWHDADRGKLTISSSLDFSNFNHDTVERLVTHVQRLKEYYPDSAVMFPWQHLVNGHVAIYQRLIDGDLIQVQGGVNGETGSVVQAEGQSGARDEVRQHLGAGSGPNDSFTFGELFGDSRTQPAPTQTIGRMHWWGPLDWANRRR